MKRIVLAAVLGALLAACSTSKLPERFHTLVPADPGQAPAQTASAPSGAAATVYVDVLPVSIPPQVDHAGNRWIW